MFVCVCSFCVSSVCVLISSPSPPPSYAGIDNSVFARGFDAVAAEFKAPVVRFTTNAQPERLWAPPQFGGLDVVQVPDQVRACVRARARACMMRHSDAALNQ